MLNHKISPYFIDLANKMKELAISKGFDAHFFPFLQQAIHENNYKKQNLIQKLNSKLLIKTDKKINNLYKSEKYNI